jgi:hypothetical protein
MLPNFRTLDRDTQMGLHDYADVALGGDKVCANQALTELLQSELVTLVEDRCRFGREPPREAIVQSVSEEARRELHGRLAERTEAAHANPIYVRRHAGASEPGRPSIRAVVLVSPGMASPAAVGGGAQPMVEKQ